MSFSSGEDDVWSQIPFPMKLTTLLNNDEFKDILSWRPNGKSFMIDNPERFESEIMPKYFKDEDYPFFTKELGRWRFARQKTNGNLEIFACEGFEQDRWDLLEKMTQRGPTIRSLSPVPARDSSTRAISPGPDDDRPSKAWRKTLKPKFDSTDALAPKPIEGVDSVGGVSPKRSTRQFSPGPTSSRDMASKGSARDISPGPDSSRGRSPMRYTLELASIASDGSSSIDVPRKDVPPKGPMSSSQRKQPFSPLPGDGDSVSSRSTVSSAPNKTPVEFASLSDSARSFLPPSRSTSAYSTDSYESIEWGDGSFPMKLMKVLEDKDWVHIISWNPSGKSFSVLHPKVFEAQVMPIHFDSRSYSSFTRELRSWGFVRQSKGPEAGGLFHEDFQEGRWDLAETIHKPKRTKRKGRLRKLNSRTVPRSYSGDFGGLLDESVSSNMSGGTGLSMEWDTISFPMKLMNVLSDKDFKHIIAWNASGKSFSILKPKEFESNVMPENFPNRKYAAFARELRTWGFVRQTKGSEAGGFMHVYFQEGRWDLVEKMQKPKEMKKKAENPIKRTNSKIVVLDDGSLTSSDLSDASAVRKSLPRERRGIDQRERGGPNYQNNSDPGEVKLAFKDIEEGRTSGTNGFNPTNPLVLNAEQARQYAIQVLNVPYEYAKESVEAYDGNRRQSDEYRLTPGLAKKLSTNQLTEKKSHTMTLITACVLVVLLAVSGVWVYFLVSGRDSEMSSGAAGTSSRPAMPSLPGVPASVSATEDGKIDCSKLRIEALGSSEISAEINAACENP